MSKSRIMGAGNASSSNLVRANGNTGGGNKKQGLTSSVGKRYNVPYNRSIGQNRHVLFYMNQLGGIGRGRSMFITGADGAKKHGDTVDTVDDSETPPISGSEESGLTKSTNGTLLLTIGGPTAYAPNGGTRLILVEIEDAVQLPSGLPANTPGWEFATQSQVGSNSVADVVGWLNQPPPDLTSRNSFAASDATSDSVKYVSMDCSRYASFSCTVNVSISRPGVVSTCYLVPMNRTSNTTVDGKTYDTILGNIQTAGISSDEWGHGYNDAQGLGFGVSCEIDLFEMTSCGFATTLHGINSSDVTDTDGFWCNINGGFSTSKSNHEWIDSFDAGIVFQSSDFENDIDVVTNENATYIRATYTLDGTVLTSISTTDIFGPHENFMINTTENVDIKNELFGYLSEVTEEKVTAIGITYDTATGWLYLVTTITQEQNEVKIEILSPGFGEDSGIDHMNVIISEWVQTWPNSDDLYTTAWLDGFTTKADYRSYVTSAVPSDAPATDGTNPYENSLSLTYDADIMRGITQETYNELNDVFKTYDYAINTGYAIKTGGIIELSTCIPPSLFFIGNIKIIKDSIDITKTYGVTLDILFRAVDDDTVINAINWTGQFTNSYGLYYTHTSIDEFVNVGELLTNVPPVTEIVRAKTSLNPTQESWTIEAMKDAWHDTFNLGAYLTGENGEEATGETVFSQAYNQYIYTVFNNPDVGTNYANSISAMSKDGVNYITFRQGNELGIDVAEPE